jgi:hypothetical protein
MSKAVAGAEVLLVAVFRMLRARKGRMQKEKALQAQYAANIGSFLNISC